LLSAVHGGFSGSRMQVRSALVAAVFRKSLRLSTVAKNRRTQVRARHMHRLRTR